MSELKQWEIDAFNGMDELIRNEPFIEPPKCHFTYMELVMADDLDSQVSFYECKHCGHTKDE